VLFLQLSFPENGLDSSSEGKEKVAEAQRMCYGKEVGFGNQPMKIAEASSRGVFRSTGDRKKDGEMLPLPCFA
jgi:hypothetical protein